jgi:nitrate reductase assembly molybdenum cofactor insertion protein NarJ
MNNETIIRRAQVYGFLSGSVPYPAENWLDDAPMVEGILRELGDDAALRWDYAEPLSLDALQEAHRLAFGATGSLCYETEYGLPHEFRQSQELADIAGFYRAFGFDVCGPTRERPDYLGVELEFMCVLALKEAYAQANGMTEQLEICVDAQRKFVQDHLGQWIGLFALGLERSAVAGPYAALARLAAAFVAADTGRLGATLEPRTPALVLPTPLAPDLSCDACPAVDMQVSGGDE